MDSSDTTSAEFTEILDLVENTDASPDDQRHAFELASTRQSFPMVTALHGFFYEFGVGTEVDCRKAEACYLQAAENDHCPCERMFALVRFIDIYRFGAPGCCLREREAFILGCDLNAMHSSSFEDWVMRYYEEDDGEDDDDEVILGVAWPLGQYLLARCLMYGWGMLEWPLGARIMYSKASACGEPFSKAALASLPSEKFTLHEQREDPESLLMDAVKARPNDGRVLLVLGHFYEQKGQLIDAMAAYRKSADSGHPLALLRLGNIFADFGNPWCDFRQAVTCYAQAASMRCGEAIRKLGKLHELGLIHGIDIDAAMRHYELWKEIGDTNLFDELEVWWRDDESVPWADEASTGPKTRPDRIKEALSRAQAGDHEAECYMGRYYAGFTDFRRIALHFSHEWFRMAHNGGNLNGTFELCLLLINPGGGNDHFYNLDEARRLAEIAVAGTFPDNRPVTSALEICHDRAKLALGEVCRLQGDLALAAHWYAESAVEGNCTARGALLSLLSNDLEACTDNASINEKILAIVKQMTASLMENKRPEDAFPFLMHFANQGDADCQRQVGKCLLGGVGVRRDPERAVSWLEKAALQDHLQACLDLFTVNHKGVTDLCGPDKEKAREFIEKAVSLNPRDPAVQYNMGLYLLEYGDDHEKASEKAVEWIKCAAEAGFKPAQRHMKWLLKNEKKQLKDRFAEYAARLNDSDV